MKKSDESDKYEPSALFRMLRYLPSLLFLISLMRGIWYYRLVPDIVPPLIPVLWPFSVPLPRCFYLLLPFPAGAFLYAGDIWVRKAGAYPLGAGDRQLSAAKPSLEDPYSGHHREEEALLGAELDAGRKTGMERIRQALSHPRVVSFLIQVIAVSLYAYVQETLLSRLAEGTDLSSLLMHVYAGVLGLSLSTFLFSVIIRIYRKNHGLS